TPCRNLWCSSAHPTRSDPCSRWRRSNCFGSCGSATTRSNQLRSSTCGRLSTSRSSLRTPTHA
ncbi:TPA: hypothetical protein N0F65_006369, partial [Lagenidium giganteum]